METKYRDIFKGFCIVILIFLVSCQNSYKQSQPEILTAEYEIQTKSETERGYQVDLEVNFQKENAQLTHILLKKKKFSLREIEKSEKGNWIYSQYLPVQSQMIQNFESPLPDTRSDGIIFEIEGKEYFYEVKFKLKQ